MIFEGKSKCPVDAPIVVCAENKNRHILNNPTRLKVYKYQIDGDILNDSDSEKCDDIIEVETSGKPTVFVIELKGSDIKKAISQISSTINRYNLTSSYNVRPRIIIHKARTQKVHDSAYRNFIRLFPDTILKEIKYEETVR